MQLHFDSTETQAADFCKRYDAANANGKYSYSEYIVFWRTSCNDKLKEASVRQPHVCDVLPNIYDQLKSPWLLSEQKMYDMYVNLMREKQPHEDRLALLKED